MKTSAFLRFSRFPTVFVSSFALLAAVRADQTLATAPVVQTGGSQTVNGNGPNGIIDGNNGSGYFVQGGSLTINNATLQNFNTVGGSGSGGGAALGGAIFVNQGASVTLNGVSFYNNTAQGGNGGAGTTGGG